MGFPFGPGGPIAPIAARRFETMYRCYSVSFIDKVSMESGGKIILPPSALDALARLNIQYPMLFELTNKDGSKKTHAGVLEFVAEEGNCYIPYWMMQNLLIEEGGFIRVVSSSLPKGTYVKLQPQSSDFLDISNHRAVLENALRNFSALTKGDIIMINYNNRNYYINILETKPGESISIVETDVNVDFAAPADYKEPPPKIEEPKDKLAAISSPQSIPGAAVDKKQQLEDPRFQVFGGSGYRLDGKKSSLLSTSPANTTTAMSTSPIGIKTVPERKLSNTPVPSSSPPVVQPQAMGNKLVFGKQAVVDNTSKSASTKADDKKDTKPGVAAAEEKKSNFVPFTGKGYSLK